jgi:hypothetical protein
MTRMRVAGKEHSRGDNEFDFGNSELEMSVDHLNPSVLSTKERSPMLMDW